MTSCNPFCLFARPVSEFRDVSLVTLKYTSHGSCITFLSFYPSTRVTTVLNEEKATTSLSVNIHAEPTLVEDSLSS